MRVLPLLALAVLVTVVGLAALPWNPTQHGAYPLTPTHADLQNSVALGGGDGAKTGSTPLAEEMISLTLEIDRVRLAAGAEFTATVTLTNRGTEEVRIEYFIGQLFEVVVTSAEGRVVYRYSATTPYGYVMSRPLQLVLGPGESYRQVLRLRAVDESGNPLPPGTYTVTAYLTGAVEGRAPSEVGWPKAFARSNSVGITVE